MMKSKREAGIPAASHSAEGGRVTGVAGVREGVREGVRGWVSEEGAGEGVERVSGGVREE